MGVARGWFVFDDGKFLPDQAITAQERAKALVDAKAVEASAQIVVREKLAAAEEAAESSGGIGSSDPILFDRCVHGAA